MQLATTCCATTLHSPAPLTSRSTVGAGATAVGAVGAGGLPPLVGCMSACSLVDSAGAAAAQEAVAVCAMVSGRGGGTGFRSMMCLVRAIWVGSAP